MNLPDCPTLTQKYDRIVMAHGGGGRTVSYTHLTLPTT